MLTNTENLSFRFIEKYGTHVIVGVKIGGKDVIHLKQLNGSDLQPIEVQNLLKKLADERFSDHLPNSARAGKDKVHRVSLASVFVLNMSNFICPRNSKMSVNELFQGIYSKPFI